MTFIPSTGLSSNDSGNQKTAFGELLTAALQPVTQISAQYGLLSNVLVVQDSAASGTASVVNEKYRCETGTASDGLASILTLRQLTYRPGQGAVGRFTAIFDTPIVNANQAAGLITAENLFTFGYLGVNFGIIHGRNGHDELQELTLTVAGGAENATVTIDGTPYTVALSGVGTVQADAFEIATSLNSQVPNYNFSSNDDQVVAQALISNPAGSFVYSSSTSVGTWFQILAGAEPTIDFIPQAAWNRDTRISTDTNVNLDYQKGNVYEIQFQYLGFGAINFYVEDQLSGDFVLVHKIQFSNTSTETSVSNPTFRIGWLVRNTGNTTNITVQGASAAAFVEGLLFRDAAPRSVSHNQPAIGSTLTNLVSLRNRITFGDKVNRAEVFPVLITGSTQVNKFAFFRIILNPVYDNPVTFEYTDKDGSIVEVTTDSVAVSGGREIGSITIVAGSSQQVRFNEAIESATVVFPGSTICIAAEVPTGAADDCQVSVTWQEDL